MAGGIVETDPERLAQQCDSLMQGAKKLYESGPNEGDMWFFELYFHLSDCAASFRRTALAPGKHSNKPAASPPITKG